MIRRVTQIRIHHANHVRTLVKGVPESLDIGFAQTFLPLAMQNQKASIVIRGERFSDLSCAIGAVVIHDQDVVIGDAV